MNSIELRGLTILGTDTDVGKSYVACHIIRSLLQRGTKVAAYKPVASGTSDERVGDGHQLWIATGCYGSLDEVNPQRFREPLAPPIAAQCESRAVHDDLLVSGAAVWRGRCDALIVEGAGGLMSPLSYKTTNAEFAQALGFPVVLVANNRLGVVNQVLTALHAAAAYSLDVRCVVLNDGNSLQKDASTASNFNLLAHFMSKYQLKPTITCLRRGSEVFVAEVDWTQLMTRQGRSAE